MRTTNDKNFINTDKFSFLSTHTHKINLHSNRVKSVKQLMFKYNDQLAATAKRAKAYLAGGSQKGNISLLRTKVENDDWIS